MARDKSQLGLLRRLSLHESDHHAIAAALNIPEKKKGAEWGESSSTAERAVGWERSMDVPRVLVAMAMRSELGFTACWLPCVLSLNTSFGVCCGD